MHNVRWLKKLAHLERYVASFNSRVNTSLSLHLQVNSSNCAVLNVQTFVLFANQAFVYVCMHACTYVYVYTYVVRLPKADLCNGHGGWVKWDRVGERAGWEQRQEQLLGLGLEVKPGSYGRRVALDQKLQDRQFIRCRGRGSYGKEENTK